MSLEEFASSRGNGDDKAVRQAAEKGWLAAVLATNALLAKKGRTIPKGTRAKQELLSRMQDRDPHLQSLYLVQQLVYLLHNLHVDCFYDGDYSIKRVERDLNKVRDYLETVRRLVER